MKNLLRLKEPETTRAIMATAYNYSRQVIKDVVGANDAQRVNINKASYGRYK